MARVAALLLALASGAHAVRGLLPALCSAPLCPAGRPVACAVYWHNDCTHLPPPRRRLSLRLPPPHVPAGVAPLTGGVSTACGAAPHAGEQLYRSLLFPATGITPPLRAPLPRRPSPHRVACPLHIRRRLLGRGGAKMRCGASKRKAIQPWQRPGDGLHRRPPPATDRAVGRAERTTACCGPAKRNSEGLDATCPVASASCVICSGRSLWQPLPLTHLRPSTSVHVSTGPS